MIESLAESTWGIPIVAALHVLAIAWFGASVIPIATTRRLRTARQIGLSLLLLTGAILFATQPHRYFASPAFRIKMFLLLVLFVNRNRTATLVLLAAIVLTSRAIAYF